MICPTQGSWQVLDPGPLIAETGFFPPLWGTFASPVTHRQPSPPGKTRARNRPHFGNRRPLRRGCHCSRAGPRGQHWKAASISTLGPLVRNWAEMGFTCPENWRPWSTTPAQTLLIPQICGIISMLPKPPQVLVYLRSWFHCGVWRSIYHDCFLTVSSYRLRGSLKLFIPNIQHPIWQTEAIWYLWSQMAKPLLFVYV